MGGRVEPRGRGPRCSGEKRVIEKDVKRSDGPASDVDGTDSKCSLLSQHFNADSAKETTIRNISSSLAVLHRIPSKGLEAT